MGLAIVKKITDSLNGVITLHSNPGKKAGTEISVQLPQYKTVSDEIVAEFKNPGKAYFEVEQLNAKDEISDENKRTLLIVEDNIPMLNCMATQLKEKHNVYIALSGAEALEKLKNIRQLDLIVSDVMMDEVNGFELYQRVAEQKRLAHIPFIFLTAKVTAEDKLHGLALGAIDYIPKPFLMAELINKIDAVLNNLEQQRMALINNTHKTLLHQDRSVIYNADRNKFEDNCLKYNLTVREKEILKLIAKGQLYKEIADTLSISERTVSKHVQNMFDKVVTLQTEGIGSEKCVRH
jgi:DNA-binding NarL/FixJ family response regulator